MKKIILSLTVAAAALLATEVNAQEYKPAAGENTLEVQFIPFSGTPLSQVGIRYRRFVSETVAVRATVNLGYSSTTTITTQEGPNQKELKRKDNSFDFALKPGIEKHFAGTDRLSPYIGAEIPFALRTSKTTQDAGGAFGADVTKTVTKNASGYTSVGLNLLFGADYYIAEKVFLGAEIGFGLSYQKESKQTVTPPTGPETVTKGGSSITIAPNVLAAFRLGVAF